MTPGGVDTDLSDCVDTDSVAVDPEESSRSSGVDDDSLGVPPWGSAWPVAASTTRVILLSRQCCQWRCRRHQGSDESTPWTAPSTTAIEFCQCRQVGVSTPQRRVGVEFRDSVAGGTIDDDRQPRVGDTVDSGVDDDRPDPRYCWVAAPTATAPHQLSLTDDFSHRTSNSPAPQQRQHSTAPAH